MDRRVMRLAVAATAVAAVAVPGGAAAHTPRAASRMDAMHERMSASLPAEERELRDRMHESCTGHHDERTTS